VNLWIQAVRNDPRRGQRHSISAPHQHLLVAAAVHSGLAASVPDRRPVGRHRSRCAEVGQRRDRWRSGCRRPGRRSRACPPSGEFEGT